jgi:hypothetical protein
MNVRKRLVNFRVTDDEFRRLKAASALHNARCLSEFARKAILETACGPDSAPAADDSVAGQLLSFDRRLARIESTVARLVNGLETADTLKYER